MIVIEARTLVFSLIGGQNEDEAVFRAFKSGVYRVQREFRIDKSAENNVFIVFYDENRGVLRPFAAFIVQIQ